MLGFSYGNRHVSALPRIQSYDDSGIEGGDYNPRQNVEHHKEEQEIDLEKPQG
ncbi:hypothetical protein RvY_13699 [Ramazzottius varieornatus]|uniref:Uncharacterized protein n=1 Tax=Ramazzottius varieornatus TaxID=947166 RepID=A0A1D1VNU0_RAMVA|nr:hypothetical protein RvY_13699 [Ramazzottius varieornatus]